ncbi:hypothetical protein ACFVYE_05400 [Streptomyces sp. NPDC058239]
MGGIRTRHVGTEQFLHGCGADASVIATRLANRCSMPVDAFGESMPALY